MGSREQSLPCHSLLSTVLEACEQVNRSGVWCSFNLVTDIERENNSPNILTSLSANLCVCYSTCHKGFVKKGKLKILRRERLLF